MFKAREKSKLSTRQVSRENEAVSKPNGSDSSGGDWQGEIGAPTSTVISGVYTRRYI